MTREKRLDGERLIDKWYDWYDMYRPWNVKCEIIQFAQAIIMKSSQDFRCDVHS